MFGADDDKRVRATGRPSRARAILVARCRRGDTDALRALAMILADDIWAAVARDALTEDEKTAAAVRSMQAVIQRLQSWHSPSIEELLRVARGRTSSKSTTEEDISAPEHVRQVIIRVAVEAAPQLWAATQRRSFWRLQGYAVIAALFLGAMMMLSAWFASTRAQRVPKVVVEGLRFRVIHPGLGTLLRDLAWELAVDEQQSSAVAVLEEASLALDEIASIGNSDETQRLHYIAWRLRATDLPMRLVDVAGQVSACREAIMDAALALEEVARCFGGR